MYEFYSRQAYFKELVKQVAATAKGERVVLTSMTFDSNDSQVKLILKELAEAARRGVNVTLLVDAYSFMTDGNLKAGPLLFYKDLNRRMSEFFAKNLKALKDFEEAGGKYTIINRPKRPMTRPFAGRCHIKLALINDKVFLGGCNLEDSNQIDMMVGWDDKTTADHLYELTEKLIKTGHSRLALKDNDNFIKLNESTELYIDSGVKKQSIIMRKALELIDEAQDTIFFACQFYPNSTTIRHLVKAHKRGVKVTIVYNHPSKHGLPINLLHHAVLIRERLRTPAILTKDQVHKSLPYLHGKLIATERGAMMGSHNYVMAGVNFGTAEIALLRYDAKFAEQAINALTSQLLISDNRP